MPVVDRSLLARSFASPPIPYSLSGGEWGMGSGEWQNPMDATHALIPYSLSGEWQRLE